MAVAPAPASVPSRTHYLPLAAAASVLQMLIMIPGYNEGGFDTRGWTIVLALSLVVSGLVFAFVVPHASARAGGIVGVVAVLSVLAFWAGLTLPLAAAAAVIGRNHRAEEGQQRWATAALVLAGLAVVAFIAIVIGDATRS